MAKNVLVRCKDFLYLYTKREFWTGGLVTIPAYLVM